MIQQTLMRADFRRETTIGILSQCEVINRARESPATNFFFNSLKKEENIAKNVPLFV